MAGCDSRTDSTELTAATQDEVQMILDYFDRFDYMNITESSAEQVVNFVHDNGYEAIESLDCYGMTDYETDDKTIYTWTIIVYTSENGGFFTDVSEDTGEIYKIHTEADGGDILYKKGL